MLQPIALEEQARELLKAGDFDQALQLADVAAAEGAPWVEDAYAEAAFLLIHGTSFVLLYQPSLGNSYHSVISPWRL